MLREEYPDQIPLFDRPPGSPPPKMEKPATPGSAKYSKFKPTRGRTLCHDCIADIHARGIEIAPFPRTVAWRLVDGAGEVTLLCDAHCRSRREQSP